MHLATIVLLCKQTDNFRTRHPPKQRWPHLSGNRISFVPHWITAERAWRQRWDLTWCISSAVYCADYWPLLGRGQWLWVVPGPRPFVVLPLCYLRLVQHFQVKFSPAFHQYNSCEQIQRWANFYNNKSCPARQQSSPMCVCVCVYIYIS